MAGKVTKRLSKAIDPKKQDFVEFIVSRPGDVSSAVTIRATGGIPELDDSKSSSVKEPDPPAAEKYSPAFLKLAAPELPALKKENRAQLLMQSPTRLYFYWTAGKNPFHTLNRAVSGQSGSYTLVLKLVNLKNDTELIQAIEPEGSTWFDVDADTEYRAEIGFYAVNRPYIRIMYSNTVRTPRKSPSPHPAESARWTVSADKFARVLDIAGFSRDAFDVALAGDDWNASEVATHSAFSQFIGRPQPSFAGIAAEEIRYAMLALAAGVPLSDLRGRISATLFAILESNIDALKSENALAALKSQFDFDAEDIKEDAEFAPAVFGSSLVNFPRKLKRTRKLSDFTPLSSSSMGR